MQSPNELRNGHDVPEYKKKKTKRACDLCRRKKIGCDGLQPDGAACSNCVSSSSECVFTPTDTNQKRPNTKSYVALLESRLDTMEKLLRQLRPGGIHEQTINPDALVRPDTHTGGIGDNSQVADPLGALTPPGYDSSSATVVSEEDDTHHENVSFVLKQLRLESDHQSFFGKSSQLVLIKTAFDIKKEYVGENPPDRPRGTFKRPEFWTVPPWEQDTFTKPDELDYQWPDQDLMEDLIHIFFSEPNRQLPLLHRPTFERAFKDGLHLRSRPFGAIVLLICACASRHSHDSRVFLEGSDSTRSCGWKWFHQFRIMKKDLLLPPSLYDVQVICLSVIFLYGSSAPQSVWSLVGIGIRFAQEAGAHRRKPIGHKHTIEDELWKRAFWILIAMDRAVSTALGRPCTVHDEDYNLKLPIECDDEYWENPDPEKMFKQPAGKPSYIASFNCHLRLGRIHGRTLQTIYSIHKRKHSPDHEQKIVAELDSALNEWIDTVPDHLRWDPNREDPLFFRQSVFIYTSYYHSQIMIHRPFVTTPSPLSFPSLAIVSNAARSCCHIVDKQFKRDGRPLPGVQVPIFNAAIVLLFQIWAGKRMGLSVDINKGMEDVHKCMRVLEALEDRFNSAGRCRDILNELAYVGNLPLPPHSPSHKRDRDENDSASTQPPTSFEETGILNEPRQIAGSRRVASKFYSSATPPGGPFIPQDYPTPSTLPMNSEELGRTFDPYEVPGMGEQAQRSGHISTEPMAVPPGAHLMADAGGPFGPDNTNIHGLMDDAFYGQMAMMFESSFGETSSDQFAAAYFGGPQFQTVSDDGHWGPSLGDPRYSWDYSG